MSFGGAKKCPRCTKAVYHAERALGPGGVDWHKSCLNCKDCRKMLDSTTLADRNGEAYCKSCYASNFGPHGFRGNAHGGGVMHTEGKAPPARAPGSPAPAAAAPAAGGGGKNFCPECGTRAAGGAFCSNCGSRL